MLRVTLTISPLFSEKLAKEKAPVIHPKPKVAEKEKEKPKVKEQPEKPKVKEQAKTPKEPEKPKKAPGTTSTKAHQIRKEEKPQKSAYQQTKKEEKSQRPVTHPIKKEEKPPKTPDQHIKKDQKTPKAVAHPIKKELPSKIPDQQIKKAEKPQKAAVPGPEKDKVKMPITIHKEKAPKEVKQEKAVPTQKKGKVATADKKQLKEDKPKAQGMPKSLGIHNVTREKVSKITKDTKLSDVPSPVMKGKPPVRYFQCVFLENNNGYGPLYPFTPAIHPHVSHTQSKSEGRKARLPGQ
ncbi:triadin-like [Protopterus annectens]|uniref:triadin-like n=1 Tax=Protopterus annectens TaxID=7888 RepID=UPI001CFB233A|nr:triadin-like [Protopterus annectens]